jgi:hypothetical protein
LGYFPDWIALVIKLNRHWWHDAHSPRARYWS